MNGDTRELIIIGGGPSGYTAALYAARANLQPLVIEGFAWGGQLMITSDVENYPGYPDGIMGPAMMQDFRRQAERFGAEFLTDDVTRVDFTEHPLRVWVGDDEHTAESVIVATGASARQLGLESERTLQGRGVSYCAVCDAAFFRDKQVVVVGGGDSAMEEAVFLTKFATKVSLVHRRSDFRASQIMLDRARNNEKIEFVTPYVVDEVLAENGQTSAVRLRDLETDGALSRDDGRVVERCHPHEGVAGREDLGLGVGGGEVVAVEHDGGAESFGAGHLHVRGGPRHHDERRELHDLRRSRNTLGMVAGGIGHDTTFGALARQA